MGTLPASLPPSAMRSARRLPLGRPSACETFRSTSRLSHGDHVLVAAAAEVHDDVLALAQSLATFMASHRMTGFQGRMMPSVDAHFWNAAKARRC